MRTRTLKYTVCGWQPITAPTSNFLQVNAQMRNLTKQKTVSSCKTLWVIGADETKDINRRQMSSNNFFPESESEVDIIVRRKYKEINDPLKQISVLSFLGAIALMLIFVKLTIITIGVFVALIFVILIFLLPFYMLRRRKCNSCKGRMKKIWGGRPGYREIIYYCDRCETKISTDVAITSRN